MFKVPAYLLLSFLLFSACAARAQTTNGSITGRVTDPSKGTIAEARVVALNLGTNFHYESTTNGAGEYTLANLPPGTYRIEVEKPGFKKLIQPGVALHVQDTLEINFEMPLGSVTDAITVANVLSVDTESATVSTVVNQTFVENLPLKARFWTSRFFRRTTRSIGFARFASPLSWPCSFVFIAFASESWNGVNNSWSGTRARLPR